MKKMVVLSVIFLLMASTAFAQSEAGVLFLLIPAGVRANGMGDAFVALADDASAVYWNPAGLGFQKGREILILHSNWLPQLASDLFYDFVAYRHHVNGIGTFGGGVTYLNMGEQYVTTERGPEIIDKFTAYDIAAIGSFGTLINENLALGLNMKIIRSFLAPYGAGGEKGKGLAWSFGVDIGVLYKAPFAKGLNFGACLSNLGPKIAYIDVNQASPQPTNLRVGVAYRLLDLEYNKITITADVNKLLVVQHDDGSYDPFYKAIFTAWFDDEWNEEFKELISHIGAEYWYADLIALRAGYWYDEMGKVKPKTFGAGLKYSHYRFDFGYITATEGHPLTDTMRFSLTISF